MSFEELSKNLSRLNCPIKVSGIGQLVGEVRLLLLEWLVRAFDEEFADQCAKESSSRTTRLAKQLYACGLGGSKQVQCEAFVASSSSVNSEETLVVVCELAQLVELSREVLPGEELRSRLARDVDFIKRIAPKTSAIFCEPVSLFPASLLDKVSFDEQIDPDQLMSQLGDLLEKLKAKIATLEAQSRLEKSDVSFLDPNTTPQLTKSLQSFGRAIAKFNSVYQSEMALWKVTSVKPNAELGALAVKIHQQQASFAS
jgi:hypothetical protein